HCASRPRRHVAAQTTRRAARITPGQDSASSELLLPEAEDALLLDSEDEDEDEDLRDRPFVLRRCCCRGAGLDVWAGSACGAGAPPPPLPRAPPPSVSSATVAIASSS